LFSQTSGFVPGRQNC